MNFEEIKILLNKELAQSTEKALIYGKIYPELLSQVFNAVLNTEKHLENMNQVIHKVEQESHLLDFPQKEILFLWINKLRSIMTFLEKTD
jgi:hypothetical protein